MDARPARRQDRAASASSLSWSLSRPAGAARARAPRRRRPSPAAPSSATGSDVARSLDGPAEAKAGSEIVVTWAGEVRNGDYVTVVPTGGSYKADDPYVNIYDTTSATLNAPAAAGEYEIWWIEGDTIDVVLARHPITITP